MNSNEELVDYLVEKGKIKSEMVEEAFRSVDRADFVPERAKEKAYIDKPLSIAKGSTISAPHIVAINTELLELSGDERVLELGSGSGYQLAILAEIAEKVVGIETEEELVKKSRKRLKERDNVEIIHRNSISSAEGLFDKILYSFAVKGVETAFNYLEPSGKIVAPVQEDEYQVLTSFTAGEKENHGRVRFVSRKS